MDYSKMTKEELIQLIELRENPIPVRNPRTAELMGAECSAVEVFFL